MPNQESIPPYNVLPNQESAPPYNVMPQGNDSGGKNTGSIIGIVLIVLVLILGGLYFWGKRLSEESSLVPTSSNSAADEAIVGEESVATATKEILPQKEI